MSNEITLKKLQVAEKEQGTLRFHDSRIESPVPCAQTNAGGNFGKFTDLEEFRDAARASGAKFGAIFNSEF